jgi:crotonobetainyl-CoA hydratase
MTEAVRTKQRGAILEVTLDRPKANAIDAATSRGMSEVFAQFAADDSLRVAILTGGGEKFFSAGWDLVQAASGDSDGGGFGKGGFGGLTQFFDLDKPVIAAINGYAAGGGFELALACDLIVCADHATLMLPEALRGITPEPIGVRRLLSRLPRTVALEMLYAGRRLSGQEAFDMGLASRVVPQAGLMDCARELADDIVANAPLAIAAIKEMVTLTESLSLTEASALEASGGLAGYEKMNRSEDAKEGPLAFAEKRDPVWKGR